jgi:hypothetical protein
MLAAEKTVQRPNRKYQWSKQLDEAGYGVWYWKMRLSAQKCNSSGSPCLDKTCDHANIDPAEAALSLFIDELTKKLTTAHQNLKEIQQQHKAKRHQSLHDRLAEAEQEAKDSDDPDAAQKAAKAIEAIIQSEHRQEIYDCIK